jgi:hypothetical protein
MDSKVASISAKLSAIVINSSTPSSILDKRNENSHNNQLSSYKVSKESINIGIQYQQPCQNVKPSFFNFALPPMVAFFHKPLPHAFVKLAADNAEIRTL